MGLRGPPLSAWPWSVPGNPARPRRPLPACARSHRPMVGHCYCRSACAAARSVPVSDCRQHRHISQIRIACRQSRDRHCAAQLRRLRAACRGACASLPNSRRMGDSAHGHAFFQSGGRGAAATAAGRYCAGLSYPTSRGRRWRRPARWPLAAGASCGHRPGTGAPAATDGRWWRSRWRSGRRPSVMA